MNKTQTHTNDTVRANHDKLKSNENVSNTMMGMLKEIKDELKQFSYHMRMDSLDLSEFFPLKNEEVKLVYTLYINEPL